MAQTAQILTAQQTIDLLDVGAVATWSPGLRGANGQLIAPTEVDVSNGCDWAISGTNVVITNNTGIAQASVYLKATRQHSDELQTFPSNAGAVVVSPTPAIPIGAKTIAGSVSEVAPLAANTLASSIGLVNQLGLSALAGVVTIPNTNPALAGVYEVDGAVSILNLNAAVRDCLIQVRDTTSGTIYWSGQQQVNVTPAAESIPFHAFVEKAALQIITLVVELVPINAAVVGDFQMIGLAGLPALAWTIEKIA